MRLPPVSKFSVISLLILSTTVAFYRYYTYFLIVSHVNGLKKESNYSQEEIDSGKAFPNEPSLRIPRPDDIYVPLLTLVPPSGTGWSLSTKASEGSKEGSNEGGDGQTETAVLETNGVIFYPWVLITSSLVETNLVSCLLATVTLIYGGRYCENIWGSTELARFLIIMTAVPNLIAYVFLSVMHWLVYRNRSVEDDPSLDSFKETVCGTTAVVAAFLVAFKQLVPEHMIVMFKGRIRLRVKRLPFLFVTSNTLAGILGYDLFAYMAWIGFLTSWIYLRFIRISYADPLLPFSLGSMSPAAASSPSASSPSNQGTSFFSNPPSTAAGIKVRGDASDSFAMATFFPEPFSLIVEAISDHMFRALVNLRILKPFTPEEVDNANARALARLVPGGISAPSSRTFHRAYQHQSPPNLTHSSLPRHYDNKFPRSSTRAEAERRRSLALRALGQDPLGPPASSSSSSSTVPVQPPAPLSAPNPAVLPAPRAGKD
ncbi:hypothetical protein AWJ20_4546 [Sugiyamaella lignohabitans]|uniref:Uncharacterized protein n=1 Tax=Sugiyamaella lignohabitans TaxID=796027 RepID=A0A167CI08_9ASCO|nr:uncharacterized protein AWJ20_4546 [Sugiyamaella lignohabitans]ANB11725.1 hypothetical protein AWJ20_4546 [Sugiyamaella lignohabitans]